MRDLSDLYYECHVTIEPIFDDRLERAKQIAIENDFRVADLLMKKRARDTEKRSSRDTFMTGRHESYSVLLSKMLSLINTLRAEGFRVWRYKIEDTIIDSKRRDVIGFFLGAH